MKSTNASAAWSIGFVVFLVFMVYAIFGGEQTGTVRTDDCRTKVRIDSSALMTWYHKFTCEPDGTGKMCAYVTTADHGVCETAYVYFVSAPATAPPTPVPATPTRTDGQRANDSLVARITEWIIFGIVAVGSVWYVLWRWRRADADPAESNAEDIMAALKRSLEITKKKP